MEAVVGFIVIYMLLAGCLEMILSILDKIPMLGTFSRPIIKMIEFVLFIIMIIAVILGIIGAKIY